MASTQIGTIFLDRQLRLRRYTSSAQAIFNLIPSDVNRPLAHITHQLDYGELIDDARRVIETLAKIEREVQSQDGRRYLARLVPYRTLEDKIDGVTLTFVDMTDRN
jgi:two-component system CheB/CheR fusion protein